MLFIQETLVLFTAIGIAQAGFVPAPTDLTSTTGYYDVPVRYKEVPEGICELTPGVKSYSGYADIDENEHIFWWFFEARNQDPTTAPLTVWINGGPGSSSMIGLFQELGPCSVDESGSPVDRPYAWNNVSNMLFIDQPTQTGFSYSIPVPGYFGIGGLLVQIPEETCPHYAHGCGTFSYPSAAYTVNSTKAAAPGMWKTLQGFMGAFPQYSRNGFNFATESYGGHYGPVFNERVHHRII
jgi:carboxypeptidase C (cathepsin A)